VLARADAGRTIKAAKAMALSVVAPAAKTMAQPVMFSAKMATSDASAASTTESASTTATTTPPTTTLAARLAALRRPHTVEDDEGDHDGGDAVPWMFPGLAVAMVATALVLQRVGRHLPT
jgi:hypothetical protein